MKFEMSITPDQGDSFHPDVADHLIGTTTSLKMGSMGTMMALVLEARIDGGRLVMMVEPTVWLDKPM